MFAKGTLKSQHVPRSKKGTLVKPPDLKGSKFKCLRGIFDDDVLRLLQELSEEKNSLVEMISECIYLFKTAPEGAVGIFKRHQQQ